jgi:hypothetical protein
MLDTIRPREKNSGSTPSDNVFPLPLFRRTFHEATLSSC